MKKSLTTKNISKLNLTLSFLCFFMALVILLISSTYAWLRRKWTNSLYGENIMIETNGSLAFILTKDSETALDSISLLDRMGLQDFTLKPVSNLSGERYDFFALNKQNAGDESFEHLISVLDVPSKWTDVGKANGYIEFHFFLLGQNVKQDAGAGSGSSGGSEHLTKYVFLTSDSSFSAYDEDSGFSIDPSNSLRIAIQVGTNTPIIFRNPVGGEDPKNMKHTGINNTKDGENWIADGVSYWSKGDKNVPTTEFEYGDKIESLELTNKAHTLNEFFGGVSEPDAEGNRYIDPDQCICAFGVNDRVEIFVRIWLEGTDDYCEESIAGLRIRLLLNFDAVDCDSTGRIVGHNTD